MSYFLLLACAIWIIHWIFTFIFWLERSFEMIYLTFWDLKKITSLYISTHLFIFKLKQITEPIKKLFFYKYITNGYVQIRQKWKPSARIELATPCLRDKCSNHWATKALHQHLHLIWLFSVKLFCLWFFYE